MSQNLYQPEYLKRTYEFLKQIKEQSYTPFTTLSGGKIVDVGCGIGQDAANLAQICPQCTVLGLDHDPELIAKAKASAPALSNLSFATSDAATLPFRDGEIAGLRNERLIQHLQAPEMVYREFYRVLKPGAPAVFVDTDWGSMCMYNGNKGIREKLQHFMSRIRVPHGEAAAELADYLYPIGFTNISVKLFPLVSHNYTLAAELLQIDTALKQMADTGTLTDEERVQFVKEQQVATEKGSFAGSVNLVMIVAHK